MVAVPTGLKGPQAQHYAPGCFETACALALCCNLGRTKRGTGNFLPDQMLTHSDCRQGTCRQPKIIGPTTRQALLDQSTVIEDLKMNCIPAQKQTP